MIWKTLLALWFLVTGMGATPSPKEVAPSDCGESCLSAIQKMIGSGESLLKPLSMELLMSYNEEGQLVLIVRKLWKHGETWSSEDYNKLQSAIVLASGRNQIPLNIKPYVISEKPDYTGVITKIDKDSRKILVVNPKEKSSEENPDPVAVYLSFAEDSLIRNMDTGEDIRFEDIENELLAEVWTDGMRLDSYPAQARALKFTVRKRTPEDL